MLDFSTLHRRHRLRNSKTGEGVLDAVTAVVHIALQIRDAAGRPAPAGEVRWSLVSYFSFLNSIDVLNYKSGSETYKANSSTRSQQCQW
jgi:hypothetical protein